MARVHTEALGSPRYLNRTEEAVQETKSDLVKLRVTPTFKARVKAEAARRGMTVSELIIALLEDATLSEPRRRRLAVLFRR
jgi:hypothetical protein